MSEPLLNEIRAAKPAAPEPLRERVRLIAVQEPEREPFPARVRFNWGWRRVALLAPAAVAVALVAGTVIGLTRPGGEVVAGGGDKPVSATAEGAPAAEDGARSAAPPSGGTALVSPAPGRLQRVDAELSLRVEDVEELSRATQRAMRIARSLGGHVAAVNYDSVPDGPGSAALTLRVPVARANDAIAQLSGLGTILGQRYGIQDLETTVDDLQRQIVEAEARVARLVRQLRSTSLVEEERAALQLQLDEARRQVADLRKALSGTRAEGALATIQLGLTTEDVQALPAEEGRLDDVKDVLVWEGVVLLYALVILGPLLLLGLLVWLVARWLRRREEARLLEQS